MQHCSVRLMMHCLQMSMIAVVQLTKNMSKESLSEAVLLIPMKYHHVFRIINNLSLLSLAHCHGIFTPSDLLFLKRHSNVKHTSH